MVVAAAERGARGIYMEKPMCRTLAEADMHAAGMLERLAEAVRRLHTARPFANDFDLFRLMHAYIVVLEADSLSFPPGFEGLRPRLKEMEAAADALLLTLELRRTPLESLQPALLPDDPAAPAFLGRAFAPFPEPREEDKAIVVEVLNGTDAAGLAAQAAKVLRSRGVDVMALGQAPRPRSRTVVYDRIGDFERAARVRAALGCPTAIAATRIDPLRGVDVSVELGGDCAY